MHLAREELDAHGALAALTLLGAEFVAEVLAGLGWLAAIPLRRRSLAYNAIAVRAMAHRTFPLSFTERFPATVHRAVTKQGSEAVQPT